MPLAALALLAALAAGPLAGCDGPKPDPDDTDLPGDTADTDATDTDTAADTDTADTDTADTADTDTGGDTAPACTPVTPLCADGACAWSADLALEPVTGTLTYDGGPTPDYGGAAEYDYILTFADAATGAAYTFYGECTGGFAADVPAGTYTVSVALRRLADYPWSLLDDPVVLREGLEVAGPTTLALDVPVSTVTGTLTYGGAPLRDDGDPAVADYVLTFAADSATYTFQGDAAAGFSADLPDGTYAVTAAVTRLVDDPWALLTDPVALGEVVVAGDGALALDVPYAVVSGTVTYGGAPLRDYGGPDAYDYTLTFAGEAGTFAFSGDAAGFEVHLPDGTYAVTLDVRGLSTDPWSFADDPLPLGEVTVAGPTTLALDLPLVTVHGTLTYGGAPLPDPGGPDDDDYTVLLTDATGATQRVDGDALLGFSAEVPPGPTSIAVEVRRRAADPWRTLTDAVPVATATLADGDTLALDLPVVTVSGTLTYRGAPLPDPGGPDDADYTLTFASADATATFDGDAAGFSAELPPGTWRLTAEVRHRSDDPWALNDDPVLLREALVVSGDTTLALDLALHPVAGAFTYDGAPLPDPGGPDDADLLVTFTELGRGLAHTFSADAAGYVADVPAGVYDVTVQRRVLASDAWSVNGEPLPAGECLAVGE